MLGSGMTGACPVETTDDDQLADMARSQSPPLSLWQDPCALNLPVIAVSSNPAAETMPLKSTIVASSQRKSVAPGLGFTTQASGVGVMEMTLDTVNVKPPGDVKSTKGGLGGRKSNVPAIPFEKSPVADPASPAT